VLESNQILDLLEKLKSGQKAGNPEEDEMKILTKGS